MVTCKDALFAIDADDAPALESIATDSPGTLDCCSTDYHPRPLLHYAAENGKLNAVRALLRLGADPNQPAGFSLLRAPVYQTPLHLAVDSPAEVEIIGTLLAHGARVDGHPTWSRTPLSIAAVRGRLDAAKALIAAGADLEWEGSLPESLLEDTISAQVIGTGQEEVADYLRSVGAPLLYSEWHKWKQVQVNMIERNIGVVNPRPTTRTVGKTPVSVFKSRFSPRKFLNQLLFTEGLAPFIAAEVGVVLPSGWPLSKNALVEKRFAWPIELLFHLSAAVVDGAQLGHADVLDANDQLLRGFVSPIDEWLVVQSEAVEAARTGGALGTVPLLVLSPVLTKKRYKGRDNGRTEAAKRASYKWERLHVPLPDMTPLGYARVGDQWRKTNSEGE